MFVVFLGSPLTAGLPGKLGSAWLKRLLADVFEDMLAHETLCLECDAESGTLPPKPTPLAHTLDPPPTCHSVHK